MPAPNEIACSICCETRRDVIVSARPGLHCWCVELEAIEAARAAEVDPDDHWLELADRRCDDVREAGR